ncbi:MAG: cyclic nucleotide-binding domain-containing protein [Elusimicrobia bacterium]|nr:cyclic nucleotide-binding domain-containing protein [Elusimicrobiota bacterium]
MTEKERLKCLKAMPLMRGLSLPQLKKLSALLKSAEFAAGSVLIEDNEKADSLYLIAGGVARVDKRLETHRDYRDLAFLGPGEFFGEMALAGHKARTARVVAQEPVEVLILAGRDLRAWLKAERGAAGVFLMGMAQVLSERVKRTSEQLMLFYDLSAVFAQKTSSPKELFARVSRHLLAHLGEGWSLAAGLYNVYNDEMDAVAVLGPRSPALEQKLPQKVESIQTKWLDETTYCAAVPSPQDSIKACLLVCRPDAGDAAGCVQIARLLGGVARLLGAAMEKAQQEQEEQLRDRLKAQANEPLL